MRFPGGARNPFVMRRREALFGLRADRRMCRRVIEPAPGENRWTHRKEPTRRPSAAASAPTIGPARLLKPSARHCADPPDPRKALKIRAEGNSVLEHGQRAPNRSARPTMSSHYFEPLCRATMLRDYATMLRRTFGRRSSRGKRRARPQALHKQPRNPRCGLLVTHTDARQTHTNRRARKLLASADAGRLGTRVAYRTHRAANF